MLENNNGMKKNSAKNLLIFPERNLSKIADDGLSSEFRFKFRTDHTKTDRKFGIFKNA